MTMRTGMIEQGLKLFLKLDGVPSNLSNLAASFDSREVRP